MSIEYQKHTYVINSNKCFINKLKYYGFKSFVYEVGYNSIQSVVNSSDVVNSHDFIGYKSYAIYSPEVGNGEVKFKRLSLVNASSGSTICYLSSFTNGTHRGFIIPENSIIFQMKKSNSSLVGSPSTTGYRVKVTTEFYKWLIDCSQ